MTLPLIRKTAFGERLHGYNIPKGFDPGPLLNPVPLASEAYRDVLLTRRAMDPATNVIVEGLMFDKAGRRIDDGRGKTNSAAPMQMTEAFTASLRAKRKTAVRIPKRCIYLGVLHGHFGHFLVESLSRAWAVIDRHPDDCVLFHHHSMPTPTGFHDPAAIRLPTFTQVVFDLLDLTPSQIVFANQDLRVQELIVPTSQFTISQSGSEGLPLIYDHLRRQARARLPADVTFPKKIYLTRARMDPGNAAAMRKSVANERELEALFTAHGFELVALETLPFDRQIVQIAEATHIAGTTGSALHMTQFNSDPETKIFAIDWRNSKTQYILDAARGIDSSHIYCFKGRDVAGRPVVDAPLIAAVVADILSGGPAAFANGEAAGAGGIIDESDPMFARDAIETARARSEFLALFERTKATDWLDHQIFVVVQLLANLQDLIGGLTPRSNGDPSEAGADPMAALLARQKVHPEDLSDHEIGDGLYYVAPSELDDLQAIVRTVPADEALAPLLILEGFFDIEIPSASLAILAFIAGSDQWDALLIMQRYVVMCRREDKRLFTDLVCLHGPGFLRAYGVFRLRPSVAIGDVEAMMLRGSATRPPRTQA